MMNFTIVFCADNATVAAGVLHVVHLTAAKIVGVFLGGQNFTSYAALGGNATGTETAPPPSSFTSTGTGDGDVLRGNAVLLSGMVVIAVLLMVLDIPVQCSFSLVINTFKISYILLSMFSCRLTNVLA